MPIRTVRDPAACRVVANAAFPRHAPPRTARTQAGTEQIGAIRLFNLAVADLLGGNLAAAVPTGWRYVRLAPGAPSGDIIEIDDTDGAPQLATHSTGSLAARIARTGNAVAGRLMGVPGRFEARILRLPQVQIEAMWLHADSGADEFVMLTGSSRAELTRDGFLRLAKTRVFRFLRRVDI